MIHNYPYTDFHELNLDYIMKLARESLGIHLEVVGNKLQLKNDLGDVISNVTISYATKAEQDKDGKDIEAYIYDAGVNGRAIVFTRGNNDTEVIPFPEDAVTDKNGKDITTYVANVSFSGENLVVTYGDNTSYSFKCPYAIKAQKDANGKDIETYMATVTVVGNALVFKDGAGVTLAEITVPYATTAGEAEVAEKARKDINGNAFVSDYGRNLIVDGNKIGIEAHDGTDLNKITVPFASLSTDATNAIQTVTISGNNIIFTTYGGAQTSIQAPYAVKAQKDDLGNNIKSTYVANVVNNSQTGEISFMDAQGHEIVSIVPTVDSAVHDSLGNDITDYVKSILTSPNSNFVTVTHGDNTVDTLTVNYSTIAWKDTYGNAIGNTYCSLLTMGIDPQDGEPIVIGWNGETPKAEIFRLKVQAVSAQKDGDGNIITETYGASLSYDPTGDKVSLLNAEGNEISYINIDDASGSVIDNIVEDADGKVTSMDIDGNTYEFSTGVGVDSFVYDDINGDYELGLSDGTTLSANAPKLNKLADVDTTGIVHGDTLVTDMSVSPAKWVPAKLYNPVGAWVLLYTTHTAAGTNVATSMNTAGNVFNSNGMTFDRAYNDRTGASMTSGISIEDMLEEGPVMVILKQAVGTVNGIAVCYEGFISSTDTIGGEYKHYVEIVPKIEYLVSNGATEQDGRRYRIALNDDGTIYSISSIVSQVMFNRFVTATKQLSNIVFNFSSGAFTEDTSNCVEPHLLFKYMFNGSPLPQLIIKDNGTNVYVAPKTYKVLKGTTEQLLPTFSSVITKMFSDTTSTFTVHILYENVSLSDGNTYSIDASYTFKNKSMVQQATNTYNDFEYSSAVTLTATTV